MSNDNYSIIEDYVIKNPTLSATAVADLITDDGATNLSHRTLRLYVSNIRGEREAKQLTIEDQVEDIQDQINRNNDMIEDLAEGLMDLLLSDDVVIKPKRVPKILYLDIETARMIVGVWSIGKVFSIGPEQVIKDWFIYGWAARWQGSDDTISAFVTPEEALARDDKRIMTILWTILEEADVVVTHNGDKFDIPKVKTRFIMNGLPPLSSFRSVDTYRIVSKQFAFASNSLKYLSHIITEKEKMLTTYSLWIECEKGVPEALQYMESYCIGDIDALQEVYLMLRPWAKGHVNLAVFTNSDEACCPNCASEDIHVIDSMYTTQQNAFPEMRCNSCGAVNRAKDTLISSAKRKAMIVPSAH